MKKNLLAHLVLLFVFNLNGSGNQRNKKDNAHTAIVTLFNRTAQFDSVSFNKKNLSQQYSQDTQKLKKYVEKTCKKEKSGKLFPPFFNCTPLIKKVRKTNICPKEKKEILSNLYKIRKDLMSLVVEAQTYKIITNKIIEEKTNKELKNIKLNLTQQVLKWLIKTFISFPAISLEDSRCSLTHSLLVYGAISASASEYD